MNKDAKIIEETELIIQPIEPKEAIGQAEMIGIIRERLNNIISVLNILRKETIKLKKPKK